VYVERHPRTSRAARQRLECVGQAHHNDNLIPDKERSTERIDGVVAGLIAMARAIRNRSGGSVYETRGILRLADL
jgi:hypothetical protein